MSCRAWGAILRADSHDRTAKKKEADITFRGTRLSSVHCQLPFNILPGNTLPALWEKRGCLVWAPWLPASQIALVKWGPLHLQKVRDDLWKAVGHG